MDANVIDLLQKQLTLERTNSAIYRAMADELENEGWTGSAKFMRKSSDDELTHADKVASFLVDRNIDPIYDALPEINVEGEAEPNLVSYFMNAYGAEQKTTAAVMDLYTEAQDNSEWLVSQFLMWFLEEQRTSEREVWDIIQSLQASPNEWRLIDLKLGE